ncbi:MAG: putative multiple sugar transport system substrate-binding protein, partial [Frankiaceae bacterium]|nr:putative multiple sugar transport system substrate-binding protein [Frankiaceae bacterium]
MRRIARTSIAVTGVALIALTACSSKSSTTTPPTTSTGTGAAAGAGFAAGSLIGVALPAKTSENWVLAGGLYDTDLTAAGFKADVQYAAATGTVADQQGQITALITKGAKVIIIGAEDGSQLGTQLAAAKAAGITVIAHDRLILNTPNLDYYVAYDNRKVGQLQGQALLDGMKAKKATGPYTIELFAGSPTDANAKVFFDGAMDVLQPAITAGTVVVGSGQTDFKQVTTDGWKPENSQRRMDALMTGTYGTKTLDGVLSPNDTLARSIIQSVKSAGKPIPVVTGQDSEVESIKSIIAGEQYSTINKDTRALVAQVVKMVSDLQAGKAPEVNDTKSYNNGSKIVPAFLLTPVVVTKANVKT